VTLLVLDNDLGFLFWLAMALEPCGHSVVPADTVSQANRLLRRLKLSVDVLVVNPAVEGAARFSDDLRSRHPQLKVIALVSQEEKESELPGIRADARHTKPDLNTISALEGGENPAESEWARFIQQVAGNRTAGGRAN